MDRNDYLDILPSVPPLPVAPALGNKFKVVFRQQALHFMSGEPPNPPGHLNRDPEFDRALGCFDRKRLEIEGDRCLDVAYGLLAGRARRSAALQLRAPHGPLMCLGIFFEDHAPDHDRIIRWGGCSPCRRPLGS